MNRSKLWLYLALLLCAGAANLIGLSRWLTHRAIAQIDRELSRAVSQVDARSQLLAIEAANLADVAARDPAVLQALSAEGEGRAPAVAQAAVQGARGASADPARTPLVATAGRGWRSYAVNGAPVQSGPQLEGLVSGAAADGARREGYAVVGDALYYLVANPAGHGTALAVGVPVNVAWLAQLRASSGADVTLVLDARPPRGTLGPRESEEVASAARGATATVSVGSLPPQPLFGPGSSPTLPLLFASAPALRAHPVALRALPGSMLVLSQRTSAQLAPVVGYGWVMLVGLLVLLLAGVGTALSITNERELVVPKDLLAAADRITRRDFTARAPVMAGTLGTVAAALNCAVEAARNAGTGAAQEASAARALEASATAEAGASADPFAHFAQEPTPSSGAAAPQLEAGGDGALPARPDAHEPSTASEPERPDAPAAIEPPASAQQVPAPDASADAELAPAEEPSKEPAADAPLAAFLASSSDAAPSPEASAAQEAPFSWPSGGDAPAGEPALAPAADAAEAAAHAASDSLSGTQPLGFAAQPAQQLAAAAREVEPEPALEPSSPAAAVTPENGVLAHAGESAAAVLQEPAGAAEEVPPGQGSAEPAASAESSPASEAGAEQQEPAGPAAPLAEPQPAAALDGDEEHWRLTYGEFLKVREQCGEPVQGLPYERFRQKLQKNRDQLVAKYGCRTVRFHVYVKDGRAALKASPVR